MKKVVIIFSIILFCSSISKAEIITQEDIQQAGLLRLSDIFLLIDDWDFSTIDGITYQASPLGLSSYQHQDWKVFLNGTPIDIDIFGSKALDRIPVDLSQIDHIRISSHPAIIAGQKATSGYLWIVTKSIHFQKDQSEANKGNFVNFRAGFGNETGDPGPYYYTEKSTPNIDKVGNIIAGGLSSSNDSTYFSLYYKREIGYPTDQTMFNRNNSIAGGYYPRQKLEAVYFDFGRRFNSNSHRYNFGLSDFDDFCYLRQYGREIPVKTKLLYAGSTGQIWIRRNRFLIYRFSYSSNENQKRENSLNLDINWKHEVVRASIESKDYQWRYLGFKFGFGFNHQAVTTKYTLDKSTINEVMTFYHLMYDDPFGKKITLDGLLNFEDNDVGYLFLSNISLYLNNRNVIRSSLSYSKTLPSETNSIWYWQEKGYNFLIDNNIDYQYSDRLNPYKKFTADISYRRQLTGNTSMQIGGYYRYFSNLYCESQYISEPPDYYAPNNPTLKTNCSGQIKGGKISLGFNLWKRSEAGLSTLIIVNLSGRYQSHVSDDALFNDLWKTVPKYKITGTVKYFPAKTLSILSRIKYQSETKWVDYDNTDDVNSNSHEYIEVDSFFSIDISAQKYFKERKIRTSFSIRNLLNDKVKYHPIGAQFDLSYFAQIEFILH